MNRLRRNSRTDHEVQAPVESSEHTSNIKSPRVIYSITDQIYEAVSVANTN